MIDFYSAKGSCGLASHIALEETGAVYRYRHLNLANGEQRRPDYLRINPRGRVPALAADGVTITETIAILTYLATQIPKADLLPLREPLNLARGYQLMSWFASSVHVSFAQIVRTERFTPDPAAAVLLKEQGKASFVSALDEMEELAKSGPWLLGDSFSVADAYMTVFWRWGPRVDADMSRYPTLADHAERVLNRPAAMRALEREQQALEKVP